MDDAPRRPAPPRPDGPVDGPFAWIGEDLAKTPDLWRSRLTADEIAELRAAADAYLATERDIGQMTAGDVPLPGLGPRLARLRETLIDGRGFEVIGGLPVGDLTRAQAAAMFCAVGAHLGTVVSQNAQGHVLGHVRDVGRDPEDPTARIYQTSARQTFHTDSADVVGLLCLKDAQSGGDSLLVSTAAVYNAMRAVRPDLADLLFDPVATDRRGEVPDGANPWFDIPVLSWFADRLTGMYQRQYIDSAQRFPDAPRLSDRMVEALDLFDATANDPRLTLSMRLAPGDMQFVHNHSLMHDRTGFVDWPAPDRRRHLLRLWLSVPGDRPLPDVFAQRFGTTTVGTRGGIIVPGTRLNAPLD
jgi:hypothetical protein